MDHFVLYSEYQPTGDQPQAIEELVKGFQEGNQCETLLGVTGSGKTFTMANVIQKLNKPTLIIAHKTSMPSIISSGLSFFAATFGVACYSQVEMIGSICTLLARGAIISMVVVILILPAMFMIFDKLICKTSIGFLKKKTK